MVRGITGTTALMKIHGQQPPSGMEAGTFSLRDQQGRHAAAMSAEDRLRETIHSGHFMMSNVPQDEEDDTVEEGAQTVLSEGRDTALPDPQLMEVVPSGRQRSNSDPMRRDSGRLNISQRKVIDSSLSKLFECMTLAYRAKLTSPKWNNFKGLKLRWTIKIRLNNVIWRAWHMQFVKQVRPLIAPFAIEVDPSTHNKAEAVVLEGKYWKRKLAMVSAEYRRWRVWYRDRANGVSPQNAMLPAPGSMEAEFFERYGDPYGVDASSWVPQPNEEPMMVEDFNFLPDFTDALLARLTNQPFPFPNPREIAQAGNADFIQPGLLQLQPSFDDFMDTLEPLQEFFASSGYSMSNSSGFGSQFSNYGLGMGANLTGGESVNASGASDLTGDVYGSSIGYWRPNMNTEDANLSIQNRHSSQGGGGGYSSTNSTQSNVMQQFQGKGSSMTSTYSGASARQNLASRTSNTSYDPYGGSTSNSLLGTDSQTSYVQQQSAYPPLNHSLQQQSYPSGISSGGTISRSTLQVAPQATSQDQQNSDLRKEMKQRSLSGPTNGQPVIDLAVLGNLANYNRSVSASSGNLAYLQPKEEIIRAAAAAAGPTKNSKKTNASVSFTLPQELTKVRRIKNAKSQETANMQLHPAPLRLETAYGTPSGGLSSGSSTLAQLLTGGSPFAVPVSSVTSVPAASHVNPPGTKKLAPKPIVKTESTPKAGPSKISPFTMNLGQPMTQNSPALSINLDSGRLSDVIPKMEFTGSQDARFRFKSEESERNPRIVENKRINHISAEQKRRGHIKSGFEVLHGLVPSLAQNASVKVSKAVVLHKGAEYIRQLKEERRSMQIEADTLRQQIETINQAVILCQQQLPATGAPVSNRARNDRMNEMLDDYIRMRTHQNWKFWLFGHIMRPLFDNFVSNVSTRSMDDMNRSTASWVDQQCTLVQLRPLIKESMRKLSTTTHVLSDPARLPDEARQAVQSKSPANSASTGPSHISSFTHRSSKEN